MNSSISAIALASDLLLLEAPLFHTVEFDSQLLDIEGEDFLSSHVF
jgi:hypothetical protein